MQKELSKVDFTQLQYNLINQCSRHPISYSKEKSLRDKIALALIQKKSFFFEKVITQEKTVTLYKNIEFYRPYLNNVAKYLNDELLKLNYDIISEAFLQISSFTAACKITKKFFSEDQNTHLVNYSIDYILNVTTFEPYVSSYIYYFENLNNGLKKTIFKQLLQMVRANLYNIRLSDLIKFRLALEKTIPLHLGFSYLTPFISEILQLEQDFSLIAEDSSAKSKPKLKYDKEKMSDFINAHLVEPRLEDIFYLLETKEINNPLRPKRFNHFAHVLLLLKDKKIITTQKLENLINQNKILKTSGNPASKSDLQTAFSQLRTNDKIRYSAKHIKIETTFNSIFTT